MCWWLGWLIDCVTDYLVNLEEELWWFWSDDWLTSWLICIAEDEEDSDEDSEEESDWDEDEDDEESEMGGYDLDVCPPGCDQVNLCKIDLVH